MWIFDDKINPETNPFVAAIFQLLMITMIGSVAFQEGVSPATRFFAAVLAAVWGFLWFAHYIVRLVDYLTDRPRWQRIGVAVAVVSFGGIVLAGVLGSGAGFTAYFGPS